MSNFIDKEYISATSDLFLRFLENGDNTLADRMDSPKQMFWDQIEDLGGTIVESEYQLDQAVVKNIRQQLADEKALARNARAEKMRESVELIDRLSTIFFETDLPYIDDEPRAILKPLESMRLLSNEEIAQIQDTIIHDDDALALITACLGTEAEKQALSDQRQLMNVMIQARICKAADDALSQQFIRGIASLFELPLHDSQRPHTFFISGLPELEDFKATIENCKEELLQSQMKYLVSRGFEKGLKNYIDYWAKRFYFNVKYEPKHTGIATKRTQLEISFKKTGQWFPSGLSAMDRKIWFARHVIEKHNSGLRLTNAEREFYNCIGDRIIITRMNAVSSRLYTYLLELLVGYTGDLVPFKRLEQHQPTPSTDSILEKKNFLISNY